MPSPWPLIGRTEELASLVGAFRRSGAGAVVTGEPGVGKTRLVAEVLDRLTDEGAATEWVRATRAAQPISLGALSHLLAPFDDVVAPDGVLRRALASLTDRPDADQLVLAVDDAHLLDEASLALLHLVATQSPVRVLLTVRAGEPVPDTLVGLWKDEVLMRLDLAPLSREQTEELMIAVLGPGVPTSVLERIWALSQGNALFVRELITAASERRRTGGSGRVLLSGPPERRLRELVEERLRLVDEAAREALELVAVAEQVPLAVAERLAQPEILEDLERRQLVAVSGRGRAAVLEVVHPLYGEVLRASLPAVARRAVLRRLADAVEHAEGFDALRLAVWRLEAGHVDDADSLVAMAHEAAARFDYALAERLATTALDLGHPEAPLVLGQALVGQGRPEDAEAVFARFEPDSPARHARWAVARGRNLFWGVNRLADALEVVGAAEAALEGAPEWQLECQSLKSHFFVYGAQAHEALDLAEAVLSHPSAREAAKVRALAAAFVLWPALGEGDRAFDYGEEWYDRARSVRDEVPFGELQLRMTRVLGLIWTGRYLDAEGLAQADLGFEVHHAPSALRGILEGLKGGVAYHRGHMWEALGRLSAAYRAFSEADWFGLKPWSAAFRARAAVFAGDLEAARDAIREAEAAYEANPAQSTFAIPDVELSRAWVEAAEGARSQAVDRLRGLAAVLREMVLPIAADALHAMARLGRAGEVADLLEEIAGKSRSAVALAYADHARALAAADGEALDAVGFRFEELGAELLAAEAFRSAANAYGRLGRGPSAMAAARRCEDLLQVCGRPVSPGLEPEAVLGEELTEREREVATLAAQGSSSQEIADRLYLSVRTVDTHLHRAYRKLMVEGRHELADALGLPGRHGRDT